MSNGYGYTLYPGGYYPGQSQDWQGVMTGMIGFVCMAVMFGMVFMVIRGVTAPPKPTLLSMLEKEAGGEKEASLDYRVAAGAARRQGFTEEADILLEIAADEDRHQGMLRQVLTSIGRKKALASGRT